MSTFYQKLTQFGTLVHNTSRAKKMDMANYFTVMHPAYPIVNNEDSPRPALRFEEKCPRSVKREVANLWKMVFGM